MKFSNLEPQIENIIIMAKTMGYEVKEMESPISTTYTFNLNRSNHVLYIRHLYNDIQKIIIKDNQFIANYEKDHLYDGILKELIEAL